MSDKDLIEYEKTGDVVAIYLNHPETLNALSETMAAQFLTAVRRARTDARALILAGRGRGFSSGASLAADDGFDLENAELDLGGLLETHFNPLILELRNFPAPVVTAVRGPAAGVGCAIALMGDIIIAGESAYFLQAFCNIGLVPDGGSAYILSRTIGPRTCDGNDDAGRKAARRKGV